MVVAVGSIRRSETSMYVTELFLQWPGRVPYCSMVIVEVHAARRGDLTINPKKTNPKRTCKHRLVEIIKLGQGSTKVDPGKDNIVALSSYDRLYSIRAIET